MQAFSKYLLLVKERILLYTRAVMCGLSAEFAVLGTASASAVYYAAKVHMFALEMLSYPVSTAAKLFKFGSDKENRIVTAFYTVSADNILSKFYNIHIYASLRLNTGSSLFPRTAESMQSKISPGTASTKQ